MRMVPAPARTARCSSISRIASSSLRSASPPTGASSAPSSAASGTIRASGASITGASRRRSRIGPLPAGPMPGGSAAAAVSRACWSPRMIVRSALPSTPPFAPRVRSISACGARHVAPSRTVHHRQRRVADAQPAQLAERPDVRRASIVRRRRCEFGEQRQQRRGVGWRRRVGDHLRGACRRGARRWRPGAGGPGAGVPDSDGPDTAGPNAGRIDPSAARTRLMRAWSISSARSVMRPNSRS